MPCAFQARRVVFPSLQSISSSNNDRSQTAAALALDKYEKCGSCVWRMRNRDCDESGKALAVVTITIRSHRFVCLVFGECAIATARRVAGLS